MRIWLIRLTVTLFCTGCGAGDVEAGCSVDADCAVRCERDHKEFPGGLCTRSCANNDDCPGGTFCIDKREGLCVTECSSHDECADFGAGYICKDKDDVHGRKQLVCLGD